MYNINEIIACTLGVNLDDNYENNIHRLELDDDYYLDLEDLFKDFDI